MGRFFETHTREVNIILASEGKKKRTFYAYCILVILIPTNLSNGTLLAYIQYHSYVDNNVCS